MMHHLIVKTGGVALVTMGGIILDERTAVPVVTAIVVAAAWGRGMWWLGTKLKGLEDGLKLALEDRKEAREVMARLVRKVDSLPCNGDECETHRKRKVDKGE